METGLQSHTSTGEEAHLQIRGVQKEYQQFKAVEKLSLNVEKGKLIALLGPSGCGKSTTLRMIAGLVSATSGQIIVNGKDITSKPAHKRDIGLVFQSYALFPHMTIAQNIAYGLKIRGVSRPEISRRVQEVVKLVHLEGLQDRRPKQLSGGQQQRVALARALVIEPSILLLDEPLSNLDAKLRDQMRNEIRDIQQRLGITTVFVTHDQVEALAMCDLVAVMNKGHLEQVGTPHEIYEKPASAFVAGFVGRTNRLEANATPDGMATSEGFQLKLPNPASGPVELMTRPHRVRLSREHPAEDLGVNSVRGVVERVTFVGDLVQTEVKVGGAVIASEIATTQAGSPFVPGMQVTASWGVNDTMVFPRT